MDRDPNDILNYSHSLVVLDIQIVFEGPDEELGVVSLHKSLFH